MTTPFATIAGHPAARVVVTVPATGAWFADVDLEGDAEVSGQVTLRLGTAELVGTVDSTRAGAYTLERKVRVVAGAGGWGRLLAPRGYHSDAGVSARMVAEDAVREAGEQLGGFSPAAAQLGIDYVRSSGPASRVLEEAAGGARWWVDYDGVTHVGARVAAAAVVGAYQVLAYDPRSHHVILAVDDVAAVAIGSILSDGLDTPETVRELAIIVGPDGIRIEAFGGPLEDGRLLSALRSVVDRLTDGRLFGLWRYRVIRMAPVPVFEIVGPPPDPITIWPVRVELQAVSQAAGLPDILPIEMRPGVAGVHAELVPGAEVLVEFVEGRRTMPVITHFAGRGPDSFAPVRLIVGGNGFNVARAARKGDSVQVTIPPGSFLVAASGGSFNPDPVVVDGEITEGSDQVGIG